jgi:hypothetical protein
MHTSATSCHGVPSPGDKLHHHSPSPTFDHDMLKTVKQIAD